ncbi:MAG TPA: FAD:protein FMN transferase, partial [Kofleriaceae bacterium]|nr:FAD:protein FMN transferase [Kofleriaceae bacterium]
MPPAMRLLTIALVLGIVATRAAAQAPAAGAPAPAPAPAAPAPGAPTKIQYSDHAMGTIVNVWLWTADERGAAQAAEAVFDEMRRLDQKMTNWPPHAETGARPDKPEPPASEVLQINAAAGDKPVKVSAETYEVIARAIDISKRSKGLFDITVGAFKG